ncbi:GmrSD restriction endonuclease domain-containing protein [Cellulomonas pakistanensis]|uniref:GmrSD restriction endonucleases N-terminal domain-containing protein n=1 Tax=Cellulomonas pakistanensis TaxID=992287 RepID=A0A919PHC0_9CELL|nr:DUF262 domain-containing protein [Cellulomonas pakistanensis]GIG38177.1 hypothetical protein Cpa01nite_35580 [Cellulomonas pakistanensis]
MSEPTTPEPTADAARPATQAKAPFKDPRPSVERVSQLAQRVLTGDILLPKFQRDFVWPRDKVLGLLDSIALNYPIGSILLWQSKQELANERSIAGLPIAEPKPDYPVNYLLDGQQRLSTVCGALHWTPNNDPDSLWNIVYDLKSQAFLHLYSLDEPPLTQVPLRHLSNPAKYFQRNASIEDAELRQRADALFNRFQDYMIAAVTLGDMPIDDIAPVFERINSTATPLTIVDLMRAATWDPAFDLRDSLDSVRTELDQRDYGGIDRKTMLRVTSGAAGYGFRVDDMDRLRGKSPAELTEIIAQVSLASRRAVDFLATHIKAPRAQSLPYANQFAVLAEIFRRVPTPSASQFTAIEQWFWRTTLSGYFGGWNTGQMSADYASIERFAAGAPRIDVPASLPRGDVWRVTQFRSNSAVSKMLALMLSYAHPVDLVTGQSIDARRSLAWNNDKEYHHFFPRDFLKGNDVPPARANSAANIVMLTSSSNIKINNKAPSQYLSALVETHGREEMIRRLETLLVPEAALDAALEDDFESFLRARAEYLQSRALALVGESESAEGAASEIEGEALITDAAVPEAAGISEEIHDQSAS